MAALHVQRITAAGASAKSAKVSERRLVAHSQIVLGDIEHRLPGVEALGDEVVEVVRDAQALEDSRQVRHVFLTDPEEDVVASTQRWGEAQMASQAGGTG